MSEFASTDRLIPRPVSPITEDDHDIFRTFVNGSDEFTLQPLGSSSDVTSLSLRACPYSVEERDVETLPGNPTRHVKGLRNLIMDWNLELFALISSTVSLSSLIILLAYQDNEPLSTWTVPLSLNTVVSILSVIIKTPLAFTVGTCIGQGKWAWFSKRQGPLSAFVAIEEAGRGPLGSLTLMWKLGFRHWVCFGAGITLALLAIDPFLQGLVQYVGEMSQTGEIGASMMRSRGLDVGEWYRKIQSTRRLDGQAVHFDCYGHMQPDIGLSLATKIGFVNASILRPVHPPKLSCRTGNCTWPAFSTLGICSSCQDISYTVEKDFQPYGSCGSIHEHEMTNYSIRSSYGQGISPPALLRASGYLNESSKCVEGDDPKIYSRVIFQPNDTHSFRDWDTLLASFAVLQAQEEYWSNKIKWNDTKVYATECALRYCIQVYQPTMINGNLDEGRISVSFEREPSSWQPKETNSSIRAAIEKTFGNLFAWSNETECWMMIPRNDLRLRLLDYDDLLPPDSDIQLIFNITHKSITSMMRSLDFQAMESINRGLLNSRNITATFENVARLMSYQMRDTNGSPVQGKTEQWVIYIKVRWELISGPVLLLLAATLFSARVVMESRGIELETSKSEPLELLLYGFDAKSRDCLRANRKAGKSIEGNIIQLEEAVEGPELRLKEGPK
ncbi:hypothetical protein CDV36_009539 [Fusarium kuroshium]|uniref:Uncharacterized protein n=1 Tax=Fusarium kuroshium TaxID=2010991 RepID=A0A3M2RZU9_9HYPO|nr:hypothetical protein CDV36_009539 [Fusarium kuroshium]